MSTKEPPTRSAFRDYLIAENRAGSNKAVSYLRALDLLQELLRKESMGFADCQDLWRVWSVPRLHELLLRVREEQKRNQQSPWYLPEQQSYLRNGFISAALGQYRYFLVEYRHQQHLMNLLRDHQGDPDELAELLNREAEIPEALLPEMEGKEAIRATKVRINQGGFRKIILDTYQNRCCITGLDIPQINIASHIIPWAENKKTRMDPRNGLCLSATYDKAFDNHLITFDEDYRLVVSNEIRDHYRNDHARELFEKREGQVIWIPQKAERRPLHEFLSVHRSKLIA